MKGENLPWEVCGDNIDNDKDGITDDPLNCFPSDFTPPPTNTPTVPTPTPTPECNLSFPWDVSPPGAHDGAVTVADIFEVAAHFGDVKATPPSQCNPSFPWDVSPPGAHDGAVTVADIFEVAAHFGDVKP